MKYGEQGLCVWRPEVSLTGLVAFSKYEYVRAGWLPQVKTWLSGHGQPEAVLNDITPGSNTGCNILLSLDGYPVHSAVQIPLADSGLNASPHFVIFQETLTRT